MKAVAHPAYRADIDGLRAVAVLAVVGFHAFPGSFSGGFVGVDVFFVISGYLISKIIIASIERDSFSFKTFYARRVRRIFPALCVVLATVLVAGWFVLLPAEYEQLGKHVAGGAGFVANLVLLSESGYFDTAAATKPLLHLWSLGIEEQFYFVWPLLLFVARKRRTVPAIALVFGASFLLNILLLPGHQEATFYSPITRFWELLIGSALAYVSLHRPTWLAESRPIVGNAASLAGIALIAFAVFRFTSEAPFPGWRALAPTCGAYLVICAGERAILNRRLLANPLMVWVGLISFPLYLWHWPLLTFARIVEAATPSLRIRLMALGASFVLAWVTYRFVETPLRVGAPKRAVAGLMTTAGALVLAGFLVSAEHGFASLRGPWNVENVSQTISKADQFNAQCVSANATIFSPKFEPDLDFCHDSSRGTVLDAIVIGDSHAGRMYTGLFDVSNLSLLDLGRGSCLPFIDYDATNPGSTELLNCSPTMGRAIERAAALRPRSVVLSGFFARAYDGRVLPRITRPLPALMRETLESLAAKVPAVIVVLDVPELPFDPSYCVDRPFRRGNGRGQCAFGKAATDASLALYEGDLRSAARGLANVTFFDPASVLCEGDQCFAVREKNLLYDDRHHLSRYGASLVAEGLTPRLR